MFVEQITQVAAARGFVGHGRSWYRLTATLVSLISLVLLGMFSSVARAESSAPGFYVFGRSDPTNLPPGGEGAIRLYVYDLGAVTAGPVALVTETLPEGVTATGEVQYSDPADGKGVRECTVASKVVTCELNSLRPGVPLVMSVLVKVGAGLSGSAVDHVTVGGGGALNVTNVSVPLSFGSDSPNFGFENYATWITSANGALDTQAGSHPYDLTVAWSLNDVLTEKLNGTPSTNDVPAGGEARVLNVNLPPGIVGDPQAVPQCPREVFDEYFAEKTCPADTQIGDEQANLGGPGLPDIIPVYNLVPPPGVAAQFAFILAGNPVFLDSGVRSGGDNGITTHVNNIPQRHITFNTTTIWGIPDEASHDVERCYTGGAGDESIQECIEKIPTSSSSSASAKPLLTMPTSCGGPLEFTGELLGTWQDEDLTAPLGRYFESDGKGVPVGLSGCERLQPFKPAVSIAPDTSYADTPAGLSVTVTMPLGLNTESLETPNLKNTTVVLPEGIVINPGQATGLVACQPSQEALGSEPDGEVNERAPSCPAASKVGTDEIESPLLRSRLNGDVYVLQSNPPDLRLMIAASGDGVNLKLVGNVHLNEQTGQLTTTFDETPDFPFTNFKLNFSGGAQAALATPTGCGVYESTADFVPWSSPFIGDALDSSRFQITDGPDASACVSPMPFAPTMTAGAITDQAGGFTDFTMLLQRGDEQQRVKTLSFKTPEGLLGMIAKVPVCPEAQANAGTCSSASQIGHTVVGAGPGPFPFYIPQASAPPAPIYLTGPYKGAPFGLSIVVPLIAGPFNLGTEVVRARIEVDRHTSQITVITDPLPQIVKGVPADLRSIDAVIDRPEFMFNPTSCAPMSFSGTATSVEGASAPLASHFQMGSCQALKFQPNFKVSTAGKTSRADGASLTVKIVYPTGNLGFNQASSQSNIASVKVDLPKQLPSRLTTLQKACPAATFEANPANCPPASIVGHARALTPVLPVPIEGPAYFVSHAGEEFPNLIIVFQGDNVTINLVGSTFISKAGVTSSTFKQVPDVPIGTFELNLPQGKYSALAANVNLCKTTLKMPTAFTGQNGAVIHETTPVSVTGCSKAKKPKRAKSKIKKASKRKRK